MGKKPTYEELEQRIRDLEKERNSSRHTGFNPEHSEAVYRLVLESISDTVILTDDHGKMVYVCPNTMNIFGLSHDQVLGLNTIQKLMNGAICDISDLKDQGEFQNLEWTIMDAEGQTRFLLVNVKSINMNGGTVLYVMHDVTELKREDENLKRYRDIVSSTIDGIALIDESYRYVVVNDSYEMFSGVTRDRFIGMTVSEYLGKEIFENKIRSNFEKCLHGETIKFQEWFDYPTLGKRFVEITYYPYKSSTGSISGVVANTRDITRQRLAEEAMVDSEQKYRNLVENANEAIFVVQEQKLVFVNPMTTVMTGYCVEELLSRPSFTESIHPDDREMVLDRHNRRLKGKELPHHYSFRVLHKDGSIMWGELNTVLINWNGKTATLNFMSDITRHKQAEAEREKLQAQLAQAHKMEAIGTLAGGIAHDFNNILSIIVGNTEMAMVDLPDWSPAQDNLNEVREATLRARELVNQILLFARRKEHAVSNIRLEPIAKESLKMLRASIPATVEIHDNIQEGLPSVLADPSQIQQIIMNLCTNAGQVMEDEGGTLTFTLDSVEPGAPLHTVSALLPPGRYVRMQTRDTGPGIPPEIVERIFDPFFTTKSVGEGTGLGLAVVHGIVQDRKGGITVESEEGLGTNFSIYLPASEVESVGVGIAEKKMLPRGTERVLFVDDEPMIMKLGQRMLERLGYTVETRESGTDALECFRQDPSRFDLVVTDMAMPGMRGDRLAEEIMAIRPDIPIILCTGYSRQISNEKAREIGVRAFVMKPLTQHELANTVRKVLDGKPRK